MKRLPYFLILLLLTTQVDDALAVPFLSPSAPLADDDDDEYLPSQRRPQEEESLPGEEPASAGLKPRTANFPIAHRGVSPEWTLTTPLTPPPLRLFMSLQI
jgi:hypothetical protein